MNKNRISGRGVLIPSIFLLPTVFVFIMAFILFGVSRAGAQEISHTGYTSSVVCSYCHADIYEGWKVSLHSGSFNSPIFQKSYRDAYTASDGKAKDICLKCHAPTVYSTNDTSAELPITKEGVTCDFCHTIEKVDLQSPAAPFALDVGGDKSASMRLLGAHPKPSGSNPAAHQAAYKEWFNKSELCAGCHEMPNGNGIRVGETYSEWKSSKYSGMGMQCQGCHMSSIKGASYLSSVNKPKKATIPDHRLSHNVENLGGAVKVEVVSAKSTEAGAYQVDIAMTNIKAGHNIPTGSPSRSLTLEVALEGDGMARVVQVLSFGKRIVDKDGNWLMTDTDAQLKGTAIKFNTSLKPMERREVTFVFSNVPSGKIKVSAQAYLTQNPIVDTEEHIHIPLGSAKK